MAGYYTNIRERTQGNVDFREILFTGHFIQLALMSLNPGEDIGLETYLETDQFICVEEGNGKAILDGLEYELRPGWQLSFRLGQSITSSIPLRQRH